ncbi:MAG: hypothetical protein Kow00107_08280 [Planctomycetota bacterium]
MKVLIVDDDRTSRRLVELILKKSNVESDSAASVEQAMEMFAERVHEVVITDWFMPGESGLDLARKIREAQGEKFSFVLCLSGIDSSSEVKEALAAGVDYFLSKPIRPDELISAIQLARRACEIRNTPMSDVSKYAHAGCWNSSEFDVILKHSYEKVKQECARMGIIAGHFPDSDGAEAFPKAVEILKTLLAGKDFMFSPVFSNFLIILFPANKKIIFETAALITRSLAEIDPKLEPLLAVALSREDDTDYRDALKRAICFISSGELGPD